MKKEKRRVTVKLNRRNGKVESGSCICPAGDSAYCNHVRPKKKKVVLFPEIGRVKIFSSLTGPHSRMCIRIYIFCFKQKNTHTETKKQKKLNKIEKQKNLKKKGRKKMLLLLTISVENLTGYDDIV